MELWTLRTHLIQQKLKQTWIRAGGGTRLDSKACSESTIPAARNLAAGGDSSSAEALEGECSFYRTRGERSVLGTS